VEAIPVAQFLAWATDLNIGPHPDYPAHLTLLPPTDHARFWVLPGDPAAWPHFVSALLGGLDPWAASYLWPRSGQWPATAECLTRNERVRQVTLRGAGVPDGWAGAIRCDRTEADTAVAVLCAFLTYGWHSPDDVWFVPDHGRQVVQTDHHDVVHAECRDEGRVLALVDHMARAGYTLPSEPPDATFKWPTWMSPPTP
jgi:hypothetical protein